MIKPVYLLTSSLTGDSAEFTLLASTKRHKKLRGVNSTKWISNYTWEGSRPVLIGKSFLWFKIYYQEEN